MRPHAAVLPALAMLGCAVLAGCAATKVGGPPSFVSFVAYQPRADWGRPGAYANWRDCPALTRTVEFAAAEVPWFRFQIGILDELTARSVNRPEPTLVIDMRRDFSEIQRIDLPKYEATRGAPVQVGAAARSIRVRLADGTTRQVDVPEFSYVQHVPRERTIYVPLQGIQPQSLSVEFPGLTVQGNAVRTGTIEFNRETITRLTLAWGACYGQ